MPTNPLGGIGKVGVGVSPAGGVEAGNGEARLGDASGGGVFSICASGEAIKTSGVGAADVSGVGVGDEPGLVE